MCEPTTPRIAAAIRLAYYGSMPFALENTVQTYPWGSRTSIPELFGLANREGEPMAEIWMGAHPKAPSVVQAPGGPISLDEWIAADAEGVLGPAVCARFSNQLPYLFKILAADSPLSIQVHPSRAQAHAGFAREERAGPPVDAPNRNYRDQNHKPELIFALTPFWGMRGFRPVREIQDRLVPVTQRAGAAGGKLLVPGDESQLTQFFRSLMTLGEREREAILAAAAEIAREKWPADPGGTPRAGAALPAAGDNDVEYYWVRLLEHLYPGDPGLLAPLFLNVFCLQPGEATYQPAGVLHAYLRGTGAELMANSDNVLRAGLTSKHMDLEELLSVGLFREEKPVVLSGSPGGDARCSLTTFGTPFEDIGFSRLAVDGECRLPAGVPLVVFCATGKLTVKTAADGANQEAAEVSVTPGRSAFVRADERQPSVAGNGVVLCATVGPISGAQSGGADA
jgi:mannose-6-phosphate isomerase